jgi:hypothetical protein
LLIFTCHIVQPTNRKPGYYLYILIYICIYLHCWLVACEP